MSPFIDASGGGTGALRWTDGLDGTVDRRLFPSGQNHGGSSGPQDRRKYFQGVLEFRAPFCLPRTPLRWDGRMREA